MDSQPPLVEMDCLVDSVGRDCALDLMPLERPFGANHPTQQFLSNSALLSVRNGSDASDNALISWHSQLQDRGAKQAS